MAALAVVPESSHSVKFPAGPQAIAAAQLEPRAESCASLALVSRKRSRKPFSLTDAEIARIKRKVGAFIEEPVWATTPVVQLPALPPPQKGQFYGAPELAEYYGVCAIRSRHGFRASRAS